MSRKESGEPPVVIPVDENGQDLNAPRTEKWEFADDDEGPKESITDIGFSKGKANRTDVNNLVVPVGANIIDSDATHRRGTKPKMKEPKSKWSGKGEQLTTDAAIEFMIKERALMDLEAAQLRRENEKLKHSLQQKEQTNDRSPKVLQTSVPVAAGVVNNKDATPEHLRKQIQELKSENERLKLQHITQGYLGDDMNAEATVIPEPPSSLALAQAQAMISNVAALPTPHAALSKKTTKVSSSSDGNVTISSLLWDGGYLWKIPYNGKGAPERRIVAIKRASSYPSPSARPVRIDRDGVLSPAENYIAFPPTIMWYNSDKPGQIKNARELILYEGSCLMEGHNTNAFYKLTMRDKPVPHPELCFSLMTTTRSLDLAAETAPQSSTWKNALHALLIEFSPNKDWAVKNLRRTKPFWNQAKMEDVPFAPHGGALSPPPVAPAVEESPAKEKPKSRPKKEVIRKQLFDACRRKDAAMLEKLFQAGVPANLMDTSTNEGDTPLLISCRLGSSEMTQVCLQFGAKNDPHPDYGETALHIACNNGSYEVAAIILAAAAQSEADQMICNLTNEEKKTPLHHASSFGRVDVVELLLSHGATIDLTDELDQTALHVCAAAGHREVLGVLLDQGGDHLLEYPDLGGNTALHHAAQNGHWHSIKLLLETAADVMSRNTRGQTAYKLAVDAGHQQIAKLLLEYMRDYKATTLSSATGISKNDYKATASAAQRRSIDNSAFGQQLRVEVSEGDGFESRPYEVPAAEKADSVIDVRGYMSHPTSHSLVLPGAQSTPSKNRTGSASPFSNQAQLQLPRPHSSQASPTTPGGSHSARQYQQGSPYSTSVDLGAANRMRSSSETLTYSMHQHQQQHQHHQHHQHQQQQQPVDVYEHSVNTGYDAYQQQEWDMTAYSYHNPQSHHYGNVHDQQGYGALQTQQQYEAQPVSRSYSDPAVLNGGALPPQQTSPVPTFYKVDPSQSVGMTNLAAPDAQGPEDYFGYDHAVHHHESYQGHTDLNHDSGAVGLWVDQAGDGHHEGQDYAHYDAVAVNGSEGAELDDGALEHFEACNAHWAVYQTEDGHVYYLDSASEHSQWEDPREAGIVHENEQDFGTNAVSEDQSSGHVSNLSPQKASPKNSPPKSPSPKAAGSRPFFGDSAYGSGHENADEVVRKKLFQDRGHTKRSGVVHRAPQRFREDISDDSGSDDEPKDILTAKNPPAIKRSQSPSISRHADSKVTQSTSRSEDGGVKLSGIQAKVAAIAKKRAETAASKESSSSLSSAAGKTEKSMPSSEDKSISAAADEKPSLISGQEKLGQPDKSAPQEKDGPMAGLSRSHRKEEYVKMLHAGDPMRVVRRKMEEAGEERTLVREILELADTISPVPPSVNKPPVSPAANAESVSAGDAALDIAAEAVTSAPIAASTPKEDIADLKSDSVVGKYAKMAGMGVPHGSVAAKMKMDGIPTKDMNRILGALGLDLEDDEETEAPAPSAPKEDIADLKSDSVVGKYAKMAGMGVPHGSVAAKMKMDGIPTKDMNRILGALGLDPEKEDGAPAERPQHALNALPVGMVRRPSVKMQTVHWETLSKDKLDKSIWATAVDDDDQDHVDEADVAELQKLFGAEEKNTSAVGKSQKRKSVDKASVLTFVDGKRAQNVTIALAQYKTMSHSELLNAVCTLDTLGGRIGADQLENLRPLMPSSSEQKNVETLEKSAHPAEIFLAVACKFGPELPRRLESFLSISHFADNCTFGIAKARKLVEACNEIISSDKLARVLQKMLAVGNVMNQGTFRGNATGFTVDSLLRMIKMKGADKKTTVLDYVVKSLYDRGEERVLVVAEDLAVLEEVSKVSSTEIGKRLGEIETAFESLSSELEKVKTSPPSPKAMHQEGPPMHEIFQQRMQTKLDEFSSKIDDVRKCRRLMARKVTEVVEYFGEDPSKCDTVQIFGVLLEFRKALNSSKDAVLRRERSTARNRDRAEQSPRQGKSRRESV